MRCRLLHLDELAFVSHGLRQTLCDWNKRRCLRICVMKKLHCNFALYCSIVFASLFRSISNELIADRDVIAIEQQSPAEIWPASDVNLAANATKFECPYTQANSNNLLKLKLKKLIQVSDLKPQAQQQQQQQSHVKVTGQVQLDISYFAKSGSLTVHVLQCNQLAPVSKRRTTSNP